MVGHMIYNCGILIKCSSAVWCPAQTRDLLLLNGKLVVVSDLFGGLDVSLRIDDNLLLEPKVDHLCITVGL